MPFNYQGVDIPYEQFGREGNAAQWAIQAFQNFYGRPPTQTELAKVVPIFAGGDKNVTDVAGGNRFVASMFEQEKALKDLEKTLNDQMTKQQTQSEEQYRKGQDELSNVLNRQRETASQYYSPTGQGYKALAGQMNNLGLANSGAFSDALAGRLADVERGIGDQAAAGFAIPSLLNQQANQQNLQMQGVQASLYPYMQSIQKPTTLENRGYDMEDFYMQSQLASRLGDMMKPSDFERGLGYANTGSNIFRNVMGGMRGK